MSLEQFSPSRKACRNKKQRTMKFRYKSSKSGLFTKQLKPMKPVLDGDSPNMPSPFTPQIKKNRKDFKPIRVSPKVS